MFITSPPRTYPGYDANGKAICLTICTENERNAYWEYTAYLDGEEAGNAIATFPRFPDESTIVLKHLNAQIKSIHGIGTALIQAIVEDSLSFAKGQIKLDSHPNALIFYWKLGFRLCSEDRIRLRTTQKYARIIKEKMERENLQESDEAIQQDKDYIFLKEILEKN
jgi:hypothetical protein